MLILASLLTLMYCLLTLWLLYHWQQIQIFYPEKRQKTTALVSVIIPVRNEAANIRQLLADMERQCWPDGTPLGPEQLEVIVVNDHSEDGTEVLVKNFDSQNFCLRLISLQLPQGFVGSHKKLALSQAIAQARGEVILTTDGDCRVEVQWVAAVLLYMQQRKAVLVSGPVAFGRGQNLFQRLQAIEFASLIGTGAACMQAGQPNMCNGANLTFRKDAYLQVKGYEGSMHIPSGDDEFLLQKIYDQYPGQVAFLKSPHAIVQTEAQPDLKSFYHQRKRWAGKWKLHKKISTALLALFIFGFHATILVAGLLTLQGAFPYQTFLGLFSAKALVEFLLLYSVLKNLDKRLHLPNFILLQFIYSAYAVFFGIVANFGGYRWKARDYAG